MSYNNGKLSSALWAVTTVDGMICWTRGGSSSTPRLMVYETEAKAFNALNNQWIKQVIDSTRVIVRQIYPVKGD